MGGEGIMAIHIYTWLCSLANNLYYYSKYFQFLYYIHDPTKLAICYFGCCTYILSFWFKHIWYCCQYTRTATRPGSAPRGAWPGDGWRIECSVDAALTSKHFPKTSVSVAVLHRRGRSLHIGKVPAITTTSCRDPRHEFVGNHLY